MMSKDLDEAVKAWLLESLRGANLRSGTAPIGLTHLNGCPSTRVTSHERGWACECGWMEHRNDRWQASAELSCDHGAVGCWEQSPLECRWLPDEVKAAMEADCVDFECRFDGDM
jgi:hypothetical protein